MEFGMVGLGRMGANMAQWLIKSGHKVTGFDPYAASRTALKRKRGGAVDSLKKLVEALPTPRVAWMMVPSGKITDETVDALKKLLDKGESSSVAATPTTRTPCSARRITITKASTTSIAAPAAACGV